MSCHRPLNLYPKFLHIFIALSLHFSYDTTRTLSTSCTSPRAPRRRGMTSMNHSGVKTFTTPTIPCRFKFCRNTSCKFWHPPVCLNYNFEKVVYMATNAISDMLRQKSKKVGAKESVAIVKEFKQLGCVSQDSYPRKSIPRQPGKLGTKHAVTFSRGTLHQIKIRERKGVDLTNNFTSSRIRSKLLFYILGEVKRYAGTYWKSQNS